MRKNKIAALAAVVALAGFLGTLAAQENAELSPNNDASNQDTADQKPWVEMSADLATAPTPELAPPTENLLSQMKVYPSF